MNWQDLIVSRCRTHHQLAGNSVYSERFDEVLKFHSPGLAPVRRDGSAWHIDSAGRPVYAARFVRTVGFYEGLAAVQASDGWYHIHPDGNPAYPERHEWCGNFQDGLCTVRFQGGSYGHVRMNGAKAYPEIWRYAGDYKDGFCVVQNDAGCSTHLDCRGKPVHGKWYVDLDVFHKGYARARDQDGWMHVDHSGTPVYAHRFAAVEPFYNGQSRVERYDGGIDIINESGDRQIHIRPARISEFASLSEDMVGFWRTQTIAAAVRTGILESLPATSTEIADKHGLHPDRALRLLRALAELALVEQESDRWRLNTRGEYLLASHPLTLADAALEYSGALAALWQHLPDALLQDGDWQRPDIFHEITKTPERLLKHHRMLNSYALHDYEKIPEALGLLGNEHIIDAGGGLGAFAEYLLKVYPDTCVTVLDKPEVIAAGQLLRAKRIGLKWLGGDLFAPWGVRSNVVTLTRVLHDWDDAEAIAILHRAREALPTGGRLLIIEMLLSEHKHAGALCDLHLLLVTGGRERTKSDFAHLLTKTGFKLLKIDKPAALPHVLHAAAT